MNRSSIVVTPSFRDPLASVFVVGDRVFRGFRAELAPQIEKLLDSSFFRERSGISLPTTWRLTTEDVSTLVPGSQLHVTDYQLWVEHERFDVISYVHEWGFSYLKRAGMFHLDFLADAIASDFVTVDGSTANVQFKSGYPAFVDIGSFRRYVTGQPWYGYRQFCEQFLVPLLLNSRLGVAHQKIFQGSLEPITLSDFSRMLTLTSWFSPAVFGHVHLQALLFPRQAFLLSSQAVPKKIPAFRLIALLRELRRFIATIKPRSKSHWTEYASNNSYQIDAVIEKKNTVHAFVHTNSLKRVIDLGCNTGEYALVCFSAGAETVVGLDADPHVIDTAVSRPELLKKNFTGLVYDVTNPAPASGYGQSERKPLTDRLIGFDGVLCLALLHHVVISNNIPIKKFIATLCSLAPRGLIEFVPRDDPMVERLLLSRQSATHEYDESVFLESLMEYAFVDTRKVLSSSGRSLFSYRVK